MEKLIFNNKNKMEKIEKIIIDNLYFIFEAFDTEEGSITWPILNYIEEKGYEYKDLTGNDTDYFVEYYHICQFDPVNGVSFNQDLINYLVNELSFSEDKIIEKLLKHLCVYLDHKTSLSKLNLFGLKNILLKYSVKKCIFQNMTFHFIITGSDDNSITYRFINCFIKRLDYVVTDGKSSNHLSLEGCKVDFLLQRNRIKKSNKIQKRIFLFDFDFGNSQIEYAYISANKVELHNIVSLGLICLENPGTSQIDIENVTLIYNPKIIMKYSDEKSPYFELLPTLIKPPRGIKLFLLRYWNMYFKPSKHYMKLEYYRYFLKNIQLIEGMSKKERKKYIKSKGSPSNILQSRYILSNYFVQKKFMNTYQKLYKQEGLYAYSDEIRKYFYYFKSRNSLIARLMFWHNGNYYKILIPLIIFLLTAILNLKMLSKLNLFENPSHYLINIFSLLENVILSPIPYINLFHFVETIIKRMVILTSYTITIYSFISLLIAIKRKISYPKDITALKV